MFPPPPAVGKIQILKMDIETLDDGREVNDSVVDLFLMYAASKLVKTCSTSATYSALFLFQAVTESEDWRSLCFTMS